MPRETAGRPALTASGWLSSQRALEQHPIRQAILPFPGEGGVMVSGDALVLAKLQRDREMTAQEVHCSN